MCSATTDLPTAGSWATEGSHIFSPDNSYTICSTVGAMTGFFFLKEEEKKKRLQLRLQESDISSKQGRWSTLQSWGKSAHTKINTSYYSLPFHTYCIPAHFSAPDANTHMKNKCSSPGAGMNFRCENLWIGTLPRSMYCTWRSLNACVSV